MKKNNVSNFFWMVIDKVTSLLSGLVMAVLLTRSLGPEEFGALSYVQSLVAIFSVFVTLGFDSILIKKIVEEPFNTKVLIWNSFLFRLLMSLVFISLALIYFIFNNSEYIRELLVLQSLTLIYLSLRSFSIPFQAQVNNVPIMKVTIVLSLLGIGVKLALLTTEAGVDKFILTDVIILTVTGCGYFWLYHSYFIKSNKFKIKVDFLVVIRLLKESWPLMLTSGSILLYAKLDQIMIKSMLSLRELGIYSISVKISESWYFIPLIVTSIFFPKIIKLKNQHEVEYNELLEQLTFYLFWFSFICMIFISFIVAPSVVYFIGDEYNRVNEIIFILSMAGLFVSLGYVNGRWMVAENLVKFTLVRNIFGLIVNVVLNFIFIPIFGIQAAAYSTLISVFISSNLSLLIFSKTKIMFIIQMKAIFRFSFVSKSQIKRFLKN
jgi:O-antigen/teichoic acid export membrane protein